MTVSTSASGTHANARDSAVALNASDSSTCKQEPHVVVEVARIAPVRRDGVDVEVDGPCAARPHAKAGFLDGLATGDGERVGFPVRVTTELQPAAELGVVGHQHRRAVKVQHYSRPRDVAVVKAVAVETARLVSDNERSRNA